MIPSWGKATTSIVILPSKRRFSSSRPSTGVSPPIVSTSANPRIAVVPLMIAVSTTGPARSAISSIV